jgi:hypothetical protein
MNWLDTAMLLLAAGAPTLIICAAAEVWMNDRKWTGEKR